MFEKIIKFSLENKLLVLISILALILAGIYSAAKIPLDAVPDITNNQVQIVSTAPTLAPQEMEQLITYPLEAAMTNIPNVTEVRSISRYGLSVITIVFEEDVPVMLARQYVQEQLNIAKAALPLGLVEPELMPITTGLGEIYQYVLTVEAAFAHQYDATELRTIQDWIVKRQMNGTKGIIEVSSFGGYLKQYDVALIPSALKVHNLTIADVLEALETNNQNSGGSYIEKGPYSFYIRTEGVLGGIDAIKQVLVKNKNGTPIKVGDVAQVGIGSAKRYGAMTMDGKGEVVGGITLMLKGANTSEVLKKVTERMEEIKKTLPEGVSIYPYLDRSQLIAKTIQTVEKNLLEGGLIVVFVLLLLLGNLRAGLIVASVIPLSLLFAFIMMNYWGISANLMSLGAIDFGIVIDGAVIIVESLLHLLAVGYVGRELTQAEMDVAVHQSTSKIYRSAAFGVLIILVVFVPILTLEGIEGKTFAPMAQTVGFALLGSMILSITYVPVMASLFLSKKIKAENGWASKLITQIKKVYQPILNLSLRFPLSTVGLSLGLFIFSALVFSNLGAEFVPTLEEGDIAMQQSIKPGSSLNESIHTSTMAEKILLKTFPEVKHVVSKIGTAEVPTDPMAIEDADIMIILKDKEDWVSASSRAGLMSKMKAALAPIKWASFEFTQPIQLRFNELMTGSKSDIAVKIFGEDIGILKKKADELALIIKQIKGASDVKVDQTDGLQQLSVQYDRTKLAQHSINVKDVNQIIRAAYAGEQVGDIFEEERKFDLVVRIAPAYRQELNLEQLTILNKAGQAIPLSAVASIETVEGPMLISREQARRFINVGVNVRNKDVATLVEEIKTAVDQNLDLPAGYELQYGGQFENLKRASDRLMIAVPLALALILLLLYLAFGSLKETLIVFMAVPMSAIGGIWALWLLGMPFSISSGIGFIALFGVSVLNGIVLLSAIKELKGGRFESLKELLSAACLSRLRPVLMTASVAALGFLPMAMSTGSGAEVQRPLAAVVIGGLITSTLLTLVILPTLYHLVFKGAWKKSSFLILLVSLGWNQSSSAQSLENVDAICAYAIRHHPLLDNQELSIQKEALNRKALNAWAPLSLNYQGGQINYGGFDSYLSIEQDISPLFRQKEKKEQLHLIETEVAFLSAEKKVLIEELRFDLKLRYNEWTYWNSKIMLYDSVLQWYTKLEKKLAAQYKAGKLDVVSWALFKKEQNQILKHKNSLEHHAMQVGLALKSAAFLEDSAVFVPTTLTPLAEVDRALDFDNSVYFSTYKARQKIIAQQVALEQIKSKQLHWNVGYFAQSLENNFVFQGFSIGVEVPIDRRVSKVKQQQLLLEQQQSQNEEAFEQHRFQAKLQQVQANIAFYKQAIENYQTETKPRQLLIQEKIVQQYAQGALDFLRFSQIQTQLLEEQDNYLDWVKMLNEQVLQLDYLTQ
ncbi:MAG: Cobalt-zinc-cadmium resistance protein CzcA; Cation efflux system protein CusA [uncultured Aureispira sp.]|uniref:Cobalt-zinc-cadmium resistance protein CzcA Cation efflux system protein CusA n=1 Tax=uncultured Aureispira sp. TaxID=1331704 RepID=A0A6S6UB97_9BACT|nr:MAG: Cobalt-zinc-cadmium resistance protein CzcA; Cation efflux system protein CusA [uncultured Aureispira sp.]